MKSQEVKKSECPACGKICDLAAPMNCSTKPVPGDISVCFGCGCINKFSPEMDLVLVPKKVLLDSAYADARKVSDQVRRYKKIAP